MPSKPSPSHQEGRPDLNPLQRRASVQDRARAHLSLREKIDEMASDPPDIKFPPLAAASARIWEGIVSWKAEQMFGLEERDETLLRELVTQATRESRAIFERFEISAKTAKLDSPRHLIRAMAALHDTEFLPDEKRRDAARLHFTAQSSRDREAVLRLSGAGKVLGIEGLRKVIEGHGGTVGSSDRAVNKFAVNAGIVTLGENPKKGERMWDLAEIEPKVIAAVKRQRRKRTDGPR